MCYLCEQFGDGGIWYLNPKNYARNMYKLRLPGEGHAGPGSDPESQGGASANENQLLDASEKGNLEEYMKIARLLDARQPGQVVPLEDAYKSLDLCSPMGLMSCVCRKSARGIDERNEEEYTCMGMGVGMLKWERWPERYKGGVKFVNLEEAKAWMKEMDRRGFVHYLMLFGAPYIGGFCQCDYPVCGAIRTAVDFGLGVLKSHYVANIDYSICNGCGVCVQRCQWGALKFEVTSEKSNIDQYKCFGCGLCETGCPRGAIKLLDRTSLPGLANIWQ